MGGKEQGSRRVSLGAPLVYAILHDSCACRAKNWPPEFQPTTKFKSLHFSAFPEYCNLPFCTNYASLCINLSFLVTFPLRKKGTPQTEKLRRCSWVNCTFALKISIDG